MKKIILVGGGGHGKVVIDAIMVGKQYEIVGIIDKKEKIGDRVLGVPIIGDDVSLNAYFRKGIKYCYISLGSIGNPVLRIRSFMASSRIGFRFPNIIHPEAEISGHVVIGEGNYVAAGVIINAGVKIGDQCIINTGAIVEHDCAIDDFVHIAPGAIVNGGVAVGRGAHIGAGSCIMQYLRIGKRALVGLGSMVIRNVEDGEVVCGNPAKKIS